MLKINLKFFGGSGSGSGLGSNGGFGKVSNPKGRSLTPASRNVAMNAMDKGVDNIGGEKIDSYGDGATYEFRGGTTARYVMEQMSDSARKAGFRTSRGYKDSFYVDDPNDSSKGIEVRVFKNTENSAPGKTFYDIEMSNIY